MSSGHDQDPPIGAELTDLFNHFESIEPPAGGSAAIRRRVQLRRQRRIAAVAVAALAIVGGGAVILDVNRTVTETVEVAGNGSQDATAASPDPAIAVTPTLTPPVTSVPTAIASLADGSPPSESDEPVRPEPTGGPSSSLGTETPTAAVTVAPEAHASPHPPPTPTVVGTPLPIPTPTPGPPTPLPVLTPPPTEVATSTPSPSATPTVAATSTPSPSATPTATPTSEIDSDGDGVGDSTDNCTLAPNPPQRDSNLDGYGHACDADLNNDEIVNFLDQALLAKRIKTGTYDADADFDGNGVVDLDDQQILEANFLQPPGPSA